eukprot:TRINITY_DN3222_c3_g1_i1.p1 TRINITY_DN3222_c3_g1~~TRINITY_DN3222_c3_g1_i1.p1  ORF type:complete len:329 (+),score=106.50 TRINITY_DN3222_c3_g1_i1:468-1454(+)
MFLSYVDSAGIADIFSIYLDYNGGGQLVLGGVDTQYYRGSITYVPLQTTLPYYIVSYSSMSIGNKKLSLSASDFGNVIVDTGTTDMLFPQSVFDAIKTSFQTNYCNVPAMCGSKTLFDGYGVSTDIRTMLPNITVVISDTYTMEISPYSYILPIYVGGSVHYYLGLGVTPSSVPGSTACLLGYAAMRGHYLIYDRANSQMGFATLSSTSSSSSSTTTTKSSSSSSSSSSTHTVTTGTISSVSSTSASSSPSSTTSRTHNTATTSSHSSSSSTTKAPSSSSTTTGSSPGQTTSRNNGSEAPLEDSEASSIKSSSVIVLMLVLLTIMLSM